MSLVTKFIVYLLITTSTFETHGAQTVNDDPVVSVSEGKLRGILLKSRGGRNYHGFLGVHYAAKPERFEAAQPPLRWEGTRNATEFGPVCPQLIFKTTIYLGDEDCLVSNIYTPKLNGKLPVMVFIHGGAFMWGDANTYGGKYLMDHDVVLVTVNYRLGVLGFLSTEDDVIQGNFGLKDQSESLKWIQRNIAAFGGDPQKVTILGESAGAGSVSYHLLSPMSRGLFTRAVVQSGSALSPWALIRNPADSAKKLAEVLQCPFEGGKQSSGDFKRCLKKKDTKEIVDAQVHFKKLDNWEPLCPFAPTLEKVSADNVAPVFLSDTAYKLLTDGKLKHKLNLNISLMIGVCEDEGLIGGAPANDDNEVGLKVRKALNEDRDSTYPIAFLYETTVEKSKRTIVAEQIHNFYFGNKTVDASTAKGITDLYSDRWFNHGSRNTAKFLAKLGVPVYPYIFSHKGKFSFAGVFGSRENYGGATHLDDLTFIFNITFFSTKMPEITQEDETDFKVSKILLKLLANFAETGDPTPTETENKWETVRKEDTDNSKEPQWYIINEHSKMANAPFASRLKFWDELPQLLEMEREVCLQHQRKDPLCVAYLTSACLLKGKCY